MDDLPNKLNKELSERMDTVMSRYFPSAKKCGNGWSMGDLDGNPSTKGENAKGSCGIYRGRGGVFLATDKGDTTNILNLIHRKHEKEGKTWAETLNECKEICGIRDVRRTKSKPKPRPPKINANSMRSTPVFDYWRGRGITEATMTKYKLRMLLRKDLPPSKQERWNEHYTRFPFFDTEGSHVMTKWLGLERKDGAKEIGTTFPQYATLWGWWLVDDNTKSIIITEGEGDSMSVAQMEPKIPALSVPSGASNLTFVENDYDRLSQFERIYILFDEDDAGETNARKLAHRLGNERCFRIHLPEGMDANEFLQSKYHNDFKKYLDAAETYSPDELLTTKVLASKAIERNAELEEALKERNFLFPKMDFKLLPKDTGILSGYIGHGKALALDTPIPTPSGFRTMNDIQLGDYVYGSDGQPVKVSITSPVFDDHDCYEVVFDDNTRVIADAGHRWNVFDGKARQRVSLKHRKGNREHAVKPLTLTTEEMSRTLKYGKSNNYSVEIAKPIEGSMRSPLPAYTLGAWLGDGSSNAGSITCHRHSFEILEHISNDGYRVSPRKCDPHDFGILGLEGGLKALGLIKNKHIPEECFVAKYDDRLSLLQGLMDTDGHVALSDKRCEFCSINRELAIGVKRLACSLGIKATMIEGDASINGKFVSKKYRVCFTTTLPVFRLKYKLAGLPTKTRETVRRRYIKEINLVPTVPVKCIGVDSQDHLFLCTDSYIPTHNTDFSNCVMLNEMRMGETVGIVAMDTPPDDLLRLCAWQMVGHSPNAIEIESCAEKLYDSLFFVDGIESELTSKAIISHMEYLVARHGVSRFLIDNLSEVADIRKDDYDSQDRFVRSIDKFDKKHGTNTMIVAHALMGESCEWKIPARRDVEGSKGMVKPIQYGLSIFRNKVKEKPEDFDEGENTARRIKRFLEGSDAYFSCWKQRNGFREEFEAPLRFHKTARWYAQEYEKFSSPYPIYPSEQVDTGIKGERAPVNSAYDNEDKQPF